MVSEDSYWMQGALQEMSPFSKSIFCFWCHGSALLVSSGLGSMHSDVIAFSH